MTNYQETLWQQLMALCDGTGTFFFVDRTVNGQNFRVFNYRLAQYSDWLKPGALSCRGTMFQTDNEGNPIRLAALPMDKFFNDSENPLVMDLDYTKTLWIEPKADGSLISTYLLNGKLFLKSKQSLVSEQARAAMSWLHRPENEGFHAALTLAAHDNITVNLEWVAPDNQIVLRYEEPKLIVLNMRRMSDGKYVDVQDYVSLERHYIGGVQFDDPVAFVKSIPSMTGIEGYIVYVGDKVTKHKTDEYCALHRAKDGVAYPRRLFEVVLEDASDDLKAMFWTDQHVVDKITEMECLVAAKYQELYAAVTGFVSENKHLDRKDFAIKAKAAPLPEGGFGLVMNSFIGRDVDYKHVMSKNWQLYAAEWKMNPDVTPTHVEGLEE